MHGVQSDYFIEANNALFTTEKPEIFIESLRLDQSGLSNILTNE